MSRVLGVLYLSGGLLVWLSLLLPHPDDASKVGLYGIVAVGVVVGGAGVIWPQYARVWMVHAVLAAGTVFICLCVYFSGVAAGIYSAMFVWVVLMAANFFSDRAVAAHIAWILVSWGITLTTVEETSGFSLLTRWILGSLVLVVAAAVLSEIVAGRRSTEELLRTEIDEKGLLQRELEYLANHDPLTGVANRRRFEQELARDLAQATRRNAPLCLVALDLDDFKRYNDVNGHGAGDRLLSLSAAAWTQVLRAGDLVARTGGDEFVILLPDCPLVEAEGVVQRLREGMPLGRTCSAGIACWDGHESATDLLIRADRFMYESKKRAGARR